MKPKVLILSRDSWNDTNSSGNTISNLFQNWNSMEIANLYCRDEIPNNPVCTKYYKISESILVKYILGKIKFPGLQFDKNVASSTLKNTSNELKSERNEKILYNFFRNNRWHIFLWLRELLWKSSKWKSKELNSFLLEFSPDIIFSFSYDSFYMHDLLAYAKKQTNAKVVFFHSDDLVTFRQYSLSPFYWINRFVLRSKMNKSIRNSEKNYCIIDEQSIRYKEIYNLDFQLLYKTSNFVELPQINTTNSPLKIVYTGNILCGRIWSLINIGNILKEINKDYLKVKLYLYTTNEISTRMRRKLTNSVEIMEKVSYDKIPNILANSDILLHVESFEKKHMLTTSLSFSTKLVDYFEAGKPILAMGWKDAASIKYLTDNNIALTANNNEEAKYAIQKMINNPNFANLLGLKSWKFGQIHHNKKDVLMHFENDLIELIK